MPVISGMEPAGAGRTALCVCEDTGLRRRPEVLRDHPEFTAMRLRLLEPLEQSRPAYQGRFELFHATTIGRSKLHRDSASAQRMPAASRCSRGSRRRLALSAVSSGRILRRGVQRPGRRPAWERCRDLRPAVLRHHPRSQPWRVGQVGCSGSAPFVHVYAGEQYNRASDTAPYGIHRNFCLRREYHVQACTERAGGAGSRADADGISRFPASAEQPLRSGLAYLF